ncbi:PrsW family intramembrane metalloprotease [Catellatospora tritici]|uniref:PrsW family intramembrane metalloprotease n=1 Tax=Catellatospora tritici TaxID=2851566 RepID=UPI001C2CF170|nr:PrsW family intramembrane metalloprotease [Catellatospora tritici]MBV1852047.1 PrsW family intramembrane metalloprotease [Catellatospora tritici]
MTAVGQTGGRRWRFSVRPTPRPARALKSLQLPAFWLLGLILLAGLTRLGGILRADLAKFPVATTSAVILFALYAVPFWLFIASMDFLEREPPLLMATAFAWGGAVATTAAIPGNQSVHDLLAKLISPAFAATWGPAIAGPTIEELLKALGVVMIVLVARKQINSVLDGMVYGALVGLGFQVVEDIVYAVNAVSVSGRGDGVGPVIATFFLRGFLAGLWSHTLFTALAGAGIAWFLVRTDKPTWWRAGGLAVGLGLAWLTHFIWNSPLFADGLGSGGAGVLLGMLGKGLPALIMVLALVWVARHREAHFYVAHLAALHDPAIATPGELQIMGHGHLRADARRYGKARCGRAGERAVRGLQTAQARLAVELSRVSHLDPADALLIYCRDEVLAQRQRLVALGHPEAIVSPCRPAVPRIVVLGALGAILLVLLIWQAIRSMNAA